MKKSYALITGASSGIGYEMADILSSMGYPVIIVARRKNNLEKLKAQIEKKYNGVVEIVAMDLSTPDAAFRLHDYTKSAGYEIELFINNAGFGMQCKFVNQELDELDKMVRLNILTATHLTQLYLRDFINRGGGKILQVSSGSAFLPTPYVACYAATKSYIRKFSEAIRFEIRNLPVSITTLYPGYTNTEFGIVANVKVPWLIHATQSSARTVAEAGIKGALKGNKSVVPGFFNKISTWSARILPTSISVFFAGIVLEGIEDK